MNTIKKTTAILSVMFFYFTGTAQLTGGFENNSAWYIDDATIKLDPTEAANVLLLRLGPV